MNTSKIFKRYINEDSYKNDKRILENIQKQNNKLLNNVFYAFSVTSLGKIPLLIVSFN